MFKLHPGRNIIGGHFFGWMIMTIIFFAILIMIIITSKTLFA